MKNLLLLLLLFACVGCGGDEQDAADGAKVKSSKSTTVAPSADSAGKVPADYAKEYYAAINNDDLVALQNLYSKGYLVSITTKRGFLKTPDPSLFSKQMDRKMYKHSHYTVREDQCGFHANNAKDVYSFCAKVFFTEEYKAVFEKANSFKADHINDEICFKLEDGVWRITDKIEGY